MSRDLMKISSLCPRIRSYDFEGHERFKTELPSAGAGADDDWLTAVIGDKNLALSDFEPLVAVGGADSVTAWDYARAAPVFLR